MCWNRITEWMSGGQQSNWCLWRKRYPRDHSGIIKAASRTYVSVCVLVKSKWIDFNKWGCFLLVLFDLSSLSSPFLPIFPVTRFTRKAGYSSYLCTYVRMYVYVCVYTYICPKWRSRYSDSLRHGNFGFQNPAESRFSAPVRTVPTTPLASCQCSHGLFSDAKATVVHR